MRNPLKLISLFSLAFVLKATGQSTPHQPVPKPSTPVVQTRNDLNFIKSLDGKYPFDVRILDKPALKKRLPQLLGEDYADFKKYLMQVATPIKVKGNFFYVWGMLAHSGGDFSSVLMGDIESNVLYVILRRDQKDKLFSEDGSQPSQELLSLSTD